jgi:ATP-binding cassette, subfamily B, bacterial
MGHFLKRIYFVYLAVYWKKGLLILGCFATMIAFDTIFPLGIKFLIDMAITPQNSRMLWLLIAGLTALYLVSSLGVLGSDSLSASVTAQLTCALRLKMFDHLQELPASYFSRTQSGDVQTRFSTDIDALENALTWSIIPAIEFVLELVISIVVLFLLDVRLSLITVVLMPLSFILPKLLVDRATQLTAQRRIEEGGLSSAVQESLQAQAVTRTFGLRSILTAGFARRLQHFTITSSRSAFTGWLSGRAADAGQYLIQLVVIAIGAILVFHHSLSVGSLVGFIGLLNSLSWTVSQGSTALAGLIPAVPSLERIESLLNESPQIRDTPNIPLPPFTGQIRFEQVSFSYAGLQARPNLEAVSFSIPYGSSVAFIGRSGSGKSTVLNLLMRFYDPDAGRILVDGQDIRQVSLASLRSQMGVVFQDTFLFNLNLRENIRMGKLDAGDAEVEAAARAAGVHEVILSLPDRYDTLAGEGGKLLSGGQRQRLALARAILRQPRILLLDESTSALDPETENLIYASLQKLRGTCTILSVTHRLAPVADMDQIVVLDQGRVFEQGSHESLMGAGGLYHSLYARQSGFTVSPDGLSAEVTPQRLAGIPLFKNLDQASREDLAAQFVPERFEAGRTVVEQGQPGNKFYIIVRGKVAVTVTAPDGNTSAPRSWQDGDYFGEIALLEGGLRTATVRTLQPSLCLSLDRRHFQNMLASHPSVRIAIEEQARGRRSADGDMDIPL